MIPSARLAATIEILEELERGPPPAEARVSAYLRARRYIGSKDRRAITGRVYAVVRHRARLAWHLRELGADPDARAVVLAHLRLVERLDRAAVATLFDTSPYSAAPPSAAEEALLERLEGISLEPAAMPPEVRGECPAWLWPSFLGAFGSEDEALAELRALTGEAPLDLRVNTLKSDREAARRALAEEGIESAATPISPCGLRAVGRPALHATQAFRDGLVEPQDEGSQIAALLVDARPGMAVLDYCAGVGGKALALAAAMGDDGLLMLHDSDPRRLGKAERRLARAGARLAVSSAGDAAALADRGAVFERVLVDAPCSGSGRWRRAPDARWRLSAEELAEVIDLQGALLREAAAYVAPGGRLVYVTCSLLAEENQAVVDAFAAAAGDFAPLPVAEPWGEILGGAPPGDGRTLTLGPRRQATDGFFVALLRRDGGP
jgi:16S rRNA (cytosine967-C5)-methyltransferase